MNKQAIRVTFDNKTFIVNAVIDEDDDGKFVSAVESFISIVSDLPIQFKPSSWAALHKAILKAA